MWLVTLAYALVAETLFGGMYAYSSTSGPLLVVSALFLLTVSAVHIRRDAKKEVAVQLSVNAVERSRRTLLEERTTIARELHDVVAHHMSVVAIQAEAAPYRVENPPPELEQAFATIRENAVAALTELRRVLGVVRADDYDAPDAPQPTLAELDGLLSNVREAGLTVEKTVTGAVRSCRRASSCRRTGSSRKHSATPFGTRRAPRPRSRSRTCSAGSTCGSSTHRRVGW